VTAGETAINTTGTPPLMEDMMAAYSERDINERIDEIQQECDRLSAEARNTLHACRKDHPLGRGKDRTDLFRNAAFVLSRPHVPSVHVEWLNKVANQFHDERAA
jgi:uncharacterized small protein (DUF1192 family)